jgi:hypothetical protein
VPLTLTANTPSAGYIHWSPFSLTFAGTEYQYAAGSTNRRYVYWLFNDGDGSPLQLSDELPELGIYDIVLFMNKEGSPINVLTTTVMDGDLIVPGTIMGKHIKSDSIDTDHLDADAITVKHTLRGSKLIGTQIQTHEQPDRGITFNSNVFAVHNAQGVPTLLIDPSDGSVIAEGGTFTGGVFQSHGAANRGIRFDATKLTAHNTSGVKKFDLDTSTGIVDIIEGKLTAGTIQTTATASRGVKITTAGIQGWNGAGVRKFYVGVDGTVEIEGKLTLISGSAVPGGAVSGTLATDVILAGNQVVGAGTNVKTFNDVLHWSGTVGMVGRLRIATPITFTARMTQLMIKGYNYVGTQNDIDLDIGFYAYNSTTWFTQHGFVNRGTAQITKVEYASDADGKAVLYLTVKGGTWQYPKINIAKAIIGHTAPDESWRNGWSATVESATLAGDTIRSTIDETSSAGHNQMDSHILTQGWRESNTSTLIGAPKIKGSLTNADLAAGQLRSGNFDPTLIMKTSSTGARMELGSLGIRAYNAQNQETLAVDSATGNVTALGGIFTGSTFQTAPSGLRMLMDSTGIHGRDSSNREYLSMGPAEGGTLEMSLWTNPGSADDYFPAGTQQFYDRRTPAKPIRAGIGWADAGEFLVGMPALDSSNPMGDHPQGMRLYNTEALDGMQRYTTLSGGGAGGGFIALWGQEFPGTQQMIANPGSVEISHGLSTTPEVRVLQGEVRMANIAAPNADLDSANISTGVRYSTQKNRYGRYIVNNKINARGIESGLGNWSGYHQRGGWPGTISGENIITRQDGIYTFTVKIELTPRHSASYRKYLQIRDTLGFVYARIDTIEEEYMTLSWTGYLTAGLTIQFPMYISGTGTYEVDANCWILFHGN